MTSILGLYVHVPFCASICAYCNFTRGLREPGVERRYVDAVVAEIERSPDSTGTADTLYFGGGTPSLLEPGAVGRIVTTCRERFGLRRDAEVTLEANPETVTRASLDGYREAGVNRISFGVQSFDDEDLARLGRIHDAAQARRAVALARQAGFDNLSLDLMLGLPGQTMARSAESVEALAAEGPEHASLYLLELHPGSRLAAQAREAGWRQVSDDEAADMYLEAMARLAAAGLVQYQISNAARLGREARHNLKYWTGGAWVAFGPAAHSTTDGARWNNVPGTEDYIERVAGGVSPVAKRQALSPREQLEERLFMGLRLAEGVDLRAVGQRFGVDVWAEYGYRLTTYVDAGLLVHRASRLWLTRKGMLLANEVMSAFVGPDHTES